ncbi:MAG: hypothetical protein IKC37_01915 [Clostridia bacterium]|nr:hypothetical protein [Clostridia bacterium]
MGNDVKTISTTNATILFGRILANTDVLTTQTDDEGKQMKVYDVLLARADKIKASSKKVEDRDKRMGKIEKPITTTCGISLLVALIFLCVWGVSYLFGGVYLWSSFYTMIMAAIVFGVTLIPTVIFTYLGSSAVNAELTACIGDLVPCYSEDSPIISINQAKNIKIERLLAVAENAKNAAAAKAQLPTAKAQSTVREGADYTGTSTLKKGDVVEGTVVYAAEGLGTYVEVAGREGLMSATGFPVGTKVKVEVVAINGDTIDLKWVR